jgi:hypothetical protein
MRILSVACLAFLAMSLISCEGEEENVSYPINYKYETLDFQPSKFYVLTATSYDEIGAVGSYAIFDDILKDELNITNWDYEIERLELLNDTQLRAYFFDFLGIIPSDTVVTYTRTGDHITFVFETQIVYPYTFVLDSDGNAARVLLESVQHSNKLTSGGTDYSSIDITFHESAEVSSVIAQRRDEYDLQSGDTVVVNYSSYLYLKQ